jgi:hypothetical protein
MIADIDFVSLIERFGVTLTFLVFLVWCVYRGGSWVGVNILLPLHQRHMLFIDRLESGIGEVTKAQTDSMKILTEILSQTKELEALHRKVSHD